MIRITVLILLAFVLDARGLNAQTMPADPVAPAHAEENIQREPNQLHDSPPPVDKHNAGKVRQNLLGPPTLPKSGFGFELGTLGKGSNSAADIFGLQLLPGGRIFMRIPLTERLFVKPSLGFFLRGNGAGNTSVTQYSGEAGGVLQYAFSASTTTLWIVALVNRLEMAFAAINSPGASDLTPFQFLYRIGPGIGFSHSMSRTLNFIADAEFAFSLSSPILTYAALTVGLMFKYE